MIQTYQLEEKHPDESLALEITDKTISFILDSGAVYEAGVFFLYF